MPSLFKCHPFKLPSRVRGYPDRAEVADAETVINSWLVSSNRGSIRHGLSGLNI
jgi:hypothetical protein